MDAQHYGGPLPGQLELGEAGGDFGPPQDQGMDDYGQPYYGGGRRQQEEEEAAGYYGQGAGYPMPDQQQHYSYGQVDPAPAHPNQRQEYGQYHDPYAQHAAGSSSRHRQGHTARQVSVGVQTDGPGRPSVAPSSGAMESLNKQRLGRRQTLGQRRQSLGHTRPKSNKVVPLEMDQAMKRRLTQRDNWRRNMTYWQLKRESASLSWKRFKKRHLRLPIWSKSLKNIEGHFGSVMGTLFHFIRNLLLLNFVLFLIWFGPVILPTIFKFDYGRVTGTYSMAEVFTLRGGLGDTWLFFGAYEEVTGNRWQMYFAYICAVIACFLLSFFWIMTKIANSVRASHTLLGARKWRPYSQLVLATWDHSRNEKNAVTVLSRGIANSLKDLLGTEGIKRWRRQLSSSAWARTKIHCIRLAGWGFYLLVLAGSFAAVWFTVEFQEENRNDNDNSIISTLGPSLVFSFVNSGVPMLLRIAVAKEKYHSKWRNRIVILRVFVVRWLTLYAFVYGLYRLTDLESDQLSASSFADGVVPQEACAGTVLGQELLRVLIIETVVSLGLKIVAQYALFSFVYRRRMEFDIPLAVIQLVFRQGITWLGMVFSPVAPLVNVLGLAAAFYVFRHLVNHTCRPPKLRWQQTDNGVFYMTTLAVTIFIVFIPLSIALTDYNPNCGPFAADRFTSMYGGIRVWIDDQSSRGFRLLVDFITNFAFLIPALIVAGVLVYFLFLQRVAYRKKLAEAEDENRALKKDMRALLAGTSLLA